MLEAVTAQMFDLMDPGILGAVMLVGVPVATIALIVIASRFPMSGRSTTADARHGASAVEQR